MDSLISFVQSNAIGVSAAILIIAYMGFNKIERQLVFQKVKNIINKR